MHSSGRFQAGTSTSDQQLQNNSKTEMVKGGDATLAQRSPEGNAFEQAKRTMKLILSQRETVAESARVLHLGEEAIYLIEIAVLPILPAKVLMRLCCVPSLSWRETITSPAFSHIQSCLFKKISGFIYEFYGGTRNFVTSNPWCYGVPSLALEFLPESVKVVSSDGGLLLCWGLSSFVYYVCNPVTREHKMLPKSQFEHLSPQVLLFEPSLKQARTIFQIACLFQDENLANLQFEIYSSTTETWRVLSCQCVVEPHTTYNVSNVHEKGQKVCWQIHPVYPQNGKYLTLDLVEEKCSICPLPRRNGILTCIRGELRYVVGHIDVNNLKISIYKLGENVRNRVVCNYEGNVRRYPYCRLMCGKYEDDLLFRCQDRIMSVNIITRKSEVWCSDSDVRRLHNGHIPYINNLVRID